LDPKVLATCKEWVSAAEVVYFLGFGFNKENLRRLGAPDSLRTDNKQEIICTRLGLTESELLPVQKLLPHGDDVSRLKWIDGDIMQALRHTRWIHR